MPKSQMIYLFKFSRPKVLYAYLISAIYAASAEKTIQT